MQIEMYDLPDAKVVLNMQCEDCGHVQMVRGFRRDGATYFSSAYNWCDKCNGLPIAIEDVKIVDLSN